MVTFQISLEQLIELYSSVSIGKLINGLIHNLNSPLHSLGIEMDMIQHLVVKKGQAEDELLKSISSRLKRVDEEFENLNSLIRLTASRADLTQNFSGYFNLNHFLEQELQFMKANLYFKHNVQTTLRLAEGLPSFRDLPENLALGFSWFIQGLVEELERQRLTTLSVESVKGETSAGVRFTIEGGEMSEEFMDTLTSDLPSLKHFVIQDTDMSALLSVFVLRSCGVSIETHAQPNNTKIRLFFERLQRTQGQNP